MAVHVAEKPKTVVDKVATQVMSTYTEDNIKTPERLEHIRLRPTAYFHSRGIEGLVHQAVELIVNAIDELALMPDGVGKLTVMLCIDSANQTYQLVLKDNGRGLPIGKLLDAYTKLHTSGKFDTTAYETSGGLYGVGAKASSGSSKHFRPVTYRPEGKASIYVNEGKCDEVVEFVKEPQSQTGVLIACEPDPFVFHDIDQFSVLGQQQLIVLLQKYCFFRKLNLEFRVHHLGLPKDIWTKPINEYEVILERYLHEAQVIFAEPTFDRAAWLKGFYWNVQRPFAHQHTFRNVFPSVIVNNQKVEIPTTVRYEVQAYYVKFDQVGGRFGMLNNLPIDEPKSSHLAPVVEAFKECMAPLIKDVSVRKFFLEQYKVSLYLAVDVRCPGAEPSGTTKDAFYSSSFRKVFLPSLIANFSTGEGAAFVAAVYGELATDIEDAYMRLVTGVTKTKNTNRLWDDLNFREKFSDCDNTDRRNTELFLVEGDSAGGGMEGRNKALQGQYKLKGKPLNGVDRIDNTRGSIEKIMRDEIYQDIVQILGLNPGRFDRASMYFQNLFIMTDADDHGYHISSLLVGNLYVLCPEMIESGMVHIVTPPLYSIDYKQKKKGTPRVYFRDDKQKVSWMTHRVYMEALKIGIVSKSVFDKIRYLNTAEYVDFIKLVLEIGETIGNIANELVLPPQIVEVLSYVTGYLERGRVGQSTEQIKIITQANRVSYDPVGHILILTYGRDDYIIPLQNVCERLYSTVIPLLQRIAWKKLQIYITSRHSPHYKDTPVSIVQLYNILQSFDELFDINRYKGLASMPPLDRNRTCMDPAYRSVHQITTVGDVSTIFNLLGSNTSHRKQLLRQE
jgi:topoisomerase IV subunit B